MKTVYTKTIVLLVLSIALQGCSLFGLHSVEQAQYEVLLQEDDYELRRYAPLAMAVTSAQADNFDEANSETFNRLFDYISGDNTRKEEISMTAPVLSAKSHADQGQDIAMTSPVFASTSPDPNGEWQLAFVLPAQYSAANAPAPTHPKVTIIDQSERLVAVVTFTGFWSQERFGEETANLKAWLSQQPYEVRGAFTFAGYDPPWTLPFLRRNEVLVEVENGAKTVRQGD